MSRSPTRADATVTPLRIGIDGRAFVSPAAGIRRYTYELTRALLGVRPGLEVTAIGLDRPELAPPGVRVRPARLSLPTNLGWVLTGLPSSARGVALDVCVPCAGLHRAARRPAASRRDRA